MSEVFKTLNALNANEHTEKKNGLTYLSWSWAWAELKKIYPDATYQIRQFDGKPYLYDENLGYMVMTEMTVEGITHEMWLPVMDGANKAMKDKPYTVQTKYKEIAVQPATMFDINTAIMRCLTKNIAMFGLGLYIYAGEDLPEDERIEYEETVKKIEASVIDSIKVKVLRDKCKELGIDESKVCGRYGKAKLEEMTEADFLKAKEGLEKSKKE